MKTKFIRFGLALAWCFAAGASARAELKSAPWPQWRGPERSGKSPETGLNTNWEERKPQLLWQLEGMGEGFASVSVAGGRLFTTGNKEGSQHVVAVDLAREKLLWSTPLTEQTPRHGYQGSRCTPTIDGERIYALASDGTLACLKAYGGEVVWKRSCKDDFGGRMMSGWGYSESPLVDGEKVLCTPGGKDALIVALEKATGREIWRSAPPEDVAKRGAGYSSLVVSHAAGVRQYVQLVGRGLVGVRAEDGEFLWHYGKIANGTANIPTPLVHGEYVFGSSGYNTGAALLKLSREADGVRAEEVYFLPARTFQNHHGGMVLVDGYVYCGHGHNNGFPICLELESGKVAWGGDVRGVGRGSAAVTYFDGHVLFRYQTGELALIQATPEEYRLKGQLKPAFQ